MALTIWDRFGVAIKTYESELFGTYGIPLDLLHSDAGGNCSSAPYARVGAASIASSAVNAVIGRSNCISLVNCTISEVVHLKDSHPTLSSFYAATRAMSWAEDHEIEVAFGVYTSGTTTCKWDVENRCWSWWSDGSNMTTSLGQALRVVNTMHTYAPICNACATPWDLLKYADTDMMAGDTDLYDVTKLNERELTYARRMRAAWRVEQGRI
jgi:hypothetical protein